MGWGTRGHIVKAQPALDNPGKEILSTVLSLVKEMRSRFQRKAVAPDGRLRIN